jgi:hypothetical protein
MRVDLSEKAVPKIIFGYVILINIIFLSINFSSNQITLSTSMLITILFCFPIGYALLLPINNSLQAIPLIRLVIYLSTGFALYFLWAYFTSVFTINPLSTYFLLLVSSIIIGYNFFKTNHKIETKVIEQHDDSVAGYKIRISIPILDKKFVSIHIRDILFLVFFVTSFFYIISYVEFHSWPPFGDSERHAQITAMQIINGRFIDHVPFSPDLKFNYPLGIHFFAANLSLLYDIPPPQIIWLLSGTGMYLFSLVILSITYILTRSTLLSAAVLLAGLHTGTGNLETFLWGYFFNGVLPTLLGFFVIFLLILLLVTIKQKDQIEKMIIFGIIIFSGIILYITTITYMALFVLVYTLVNFPKRNYLTDKFSFRINKKILPTLSFFIIIIVVLTILTGDLLDYYKHIFEFINTNSAKEITVNFVSGVNKFYYDLFFIISITLGGISSLYLLFWQKNARFFGIISLLFILMQVNANYFGDLGFLISSARYSAIVIIFSWISISIMISSFWKNTLSIIKVITHDLPKDDLVYASLTLIRTAFNLSKKRRFIEIHTDFPRKNTFSKNIVIGCFLVVTLILLLPDFASAGWYSTDGDYRYSDNVNKQQGAMMWVKENIGSDELILNAPANTNDRTYKWIPGIEYKRIVNNDIGNGLSEYERNEINDAFSYPYYPMNLETKLDKFDVKYIITDKVNDLNILQKYSFLILVYNDQNSLIFKTQPQNGLSIEEYIELKLN